MKEKGIFDECSSVINIRSRWLVKVLENKQSLKDTQLLRV